MLLIDLYLSPRPIFLQSKGFRWTNDLLLTEPFSVQDNGFVDNSLTDIIKNVTEFIQPQMNPGTKH